MRVNTYTDDQLAVFDKYAMMAVEVQSKRDRRKKNLDWQKVYDLVHAGEASDLQPIIDAKGWATVRKFIATRRRRLRLQ